MTKTLASKDGLSSCFNEQFILWIIYWDIAWVLGFHILEKEEFKNMRNINTDFTIFIHNLKLFSFPKGKMRIRHLTFYSFQ